MHSSSDRGVEEDDSFLLWKGFEKEGIRNDRRTLRGYRADDYFRVTKAQSCRRNSINDKKIEMVTYRS